MKQAPPREPSELRNLTGYKQQLKEALELHRKGAWANAKQLYERILEAQPDNYDALQLLGVLASETKNYEASVALIGKAIAINPEQATVHSNLGFALKALGRYAESVNSYLNAINLKPEFADAHLHCGLAYLGMDEPLQAIASFDQVIALRIDDASAHCNRGVALAKLGRLDEAIAAYQAALSFKPDLPEAYFNWGNALQLLRSYEMAIAAYDQAIAIRADYAQAHWNKSMALLLRGDLENGFKLFEWRWRCSAFTSKQRNFKQALWLGAESLQGKTILLHAEQGLGDTIQFCRYCEAVLALGAIVLLEVQAPLVGLLASLRGVSRLIKRGDPLPEFDFHCPLMSLPLALKTGLDSIPAAPHYLRADPAKVALWKNRLGEKKVQRVGLVWSGSQTHRNDKTRSIPLADFIGSLPLGFEYISLQKEIRAEDGPFLTHSYIRTFENELNDFSDTAALCDLMDLIISVDTSVAHLAGALGRKVWLMLPHIPDWRWMLQRDDSPWYPSIRILRLKEQGSWASLLRTCGEEIFMEKIEFNVSKNKINIQL